jgi:hypothetical protein
VRRITLAVVIASFDSFPDTKLQNFRELYVRGTRNQEFLQVFRKIFRARVPGTQRSSSRRGVTGG